MFGLGVGELLLIFGIIIFLFGSKKIPSLAKGMGEAIREFKKAREDNTSDSEEKKNSLS